jgi:hypothetical protein
MRAQICPVLDANDYLDRIFESKHLATRAVLKASKARVTNRYSDFLDATSKKTSIRKEAWTTIEKNALCGCYDGTTIPLNELKNSILKALQSQAEINLERCPYCMANAPDSWDHFLPKSCFPEYSVHHSNLVYVCYRCNFRKSDIHDDNHLLFCHPYYAVSNEVPVLQCQARIVASKLKLTFSCSAPAGNEALVKIANEHITRLGLVKNFQIDSAGIISSFIAELRQRCPTGLKEDQLRHIMQSKFESIDNALGPNAWEARLWHGLNKCAGLIDYFNEKIINQSITIRQGFDAPY